MSEEQTAAPNRTSYEWNDYILSLFGPEELIKGNPTVDGMRRVVELVIGPIIDIETTIHQTPSPDNKGRATVSCNVVVYLGNNSTKAASGAADVFTGNINAPFCNHPVSTAETRAEGRALKRLLGLRKVLAAEELSNIEPSAEIDPDMPTHIVDNQIVYINMLCGKSRLNINVKSLIQSQYPKYDNIKKMTYQQTLDLCRVLNDYQNDKESIPAELVGYDEKWQSYFNS